MRANKGERRLARGERKKRRKEFAKAEQARRRLSDRERHINMRLQALEASFARRELLNFLKSKRYELNPLSLANAAAGLPYMGWRRSMLRNRTSQSVIANLPLYEMFRAIHYLVGTADAKTEGALRNHFRNGIPALPSRYHAPKVKLAEDWLYVERAIRQSCRAKPHPNAFPFEIMKRYLKEVRSKSEVDRLRAQRAKLTLSKARMGYG